MAMQSDLRDIYQSSRLVGFTSTESAKNVTSDDDVVVVDGEAPSIVADLAVQLSDNDDQRHLLGVFRDYLRASNYSVGGTELFAAGNDELSLDVYGKPPLFYTLYYYR